MFMLPDKIWWTQINSSSKLIDELLDSLRSEKNVFLTTKCNIPWKSLLYNQIAHRIGEVSSSKTIRFINNNENTSPGKQILNCCSDDERVAYWPGMKYSEYIATLENSVVNKLFIWVKGIESSDNASEWRYFVEEYNDNSKGKNHPKALFILENSSSNNRINSEYFSNIDISFDDYDKYILCINIASQLNCSYLFKQYIADLSASLGGSDVELCADLAVNGINLSSNPLLVYKEACGTKNDISDDEIKSRILISQMKIIFPLLEQNRKKLINKYKKQISDVLPITNSFNEIINNPNDLELSSLVNMINGAKIEVTYDDKQNAMYYRNIRNRIAHNDIIDFVNLKLLLDDKTR